MSIEEFSIDKFVDECIKTDASGMIISYKGKFVYTACGCINNKSKKTCLTENIQGIISRKYVRGELYNRAETIHELLGRNSEVYDTFDYPTDDATEARIGIISKREHQLLLKSLKEKFQENQ